MDLYDHYIQTTCSGNGLQFTCRLAWCFASLTTVSSEAGASHCVHSPSHQRPSSLHVPTHLLLQPVTPSSTLPSDPFSPSFRRADRFPPSHLEDLGLPRLLCGWRRNVLLTGTRAVMRLLALPLRPDSHALCCPCLELPCRLPGLLRSW